jgi:hypothetical protein
MARPPDIFTPSMSDAAVKAKTGKEWDDWFATLDQAGAADLEHPAIATFLSNNYALPGWWCQCITVNYEQARGRRVRHQTTSGFSAGVTDVERERKAWKAGLAKPQAMFMAPSSRSRD